MEDTVRIRTPEHVELSFDLAGPGSRFVALAIDVLVRVLIVVLVSLAFGLFSLVHTVESAGTLGSAGTALVIAVVFLVAWGYMVFFETLMRGQTPGKRALGIRVVTQTGLPIGFRHALIRNLLRLVDTLPPPLYLVGGVSVAASPRGQRLGDMAAGTIVVRERFARERTGADRRSADWIAKIERGQSAHAVVLPRGTVDIRQVSLIERYFSRRAALTDTQRRDLSWQIARPLLGLFDVAPRTWEDLSDRSERCEALMREVLTLAQPAPKAPDTRSSSGPADQKTRTWDRFSTQIEALERGGRHALTLLSPADLRGLLVDYRRVTTDLARAQSMRADRDTLLRLSRMVSAGHTVLYGYRRDGRRVGVGAAFGVFAREVRASAAAVVLSAALLLGAATVSGVALQWHPQIAYDLVGPEFYDFRPADGVSIHRIPQLMRPVAASAIVANNLQVAILAFAAGLTFGLGTVFLLVYNGISIGGVMGWFGAKGHGASIWGWVMPHGGLEITAIILAGAAGLLLAGALIAPGNRTRADALRHAARRAVVIELGCMAMLLVAGLIEGFVSPSQIGYGPRIAIFVSSVSAWLLYVLLAGRSPRPDASGPARASG